MREIIFIYSPHIPPDLNLGLAEPAPPDLLSKLFNLIIMKQAQTESTQLWLESNYPF